MRFESRLASAMALIEPVILVGMGIVVGFVLLSLYMPIFSLGATYTHNIVEFKLEPKGGSTNVTWEMQGPAPFVSKVMQVFVSMDNMVGKDFETGLANLKALAEK